MATIGERIARGLRGGKRPAGPAPRREAPVRDVPGSIARPETLGFAQFTASRDSINGAEVELARFTVPRRAMLAGRDDGFRLFLKARAEADLTNDANTSEQVDVGALGLDLVRTTRPAPSLPTSRHPDVAAYTSTDGGATWTAANITAVDFDADTVTVAKPANVAVSVRVYATIRQGLVRVAAAAPAGSSAIEVPIWNSTVGALHDTDQAEKSARPNLVRSFGKPLYLSPKFQLRVYVTAASAGVFTWASEARHEIAVPVARRAVEVVNARELVAENLRQLRPGG